MLFKTYGYNVRDRFWFGRSVRFHLSMSSQKQTMAQALNFISDMKFGHYMKIPPKQMFWCQVSSDILGVGHCAKFYLIGHTDDHGGDSPDRGSSLDVCKHLVRRFLTFIAFSESLFSRGIWQGHVFSHTKTRVSKLFLYSASVILHSNSFICVDTQVFGTSSIMWGKSQIATFSDLRLENGSGT